MGLAVILINLITVTSTCIFYSAPCYLLVKYHTILNYYTKFIFNKHITTGGIWTVWLYRSSNKLLFHNNYSTFVILFVKS